MRPRPAVRTCAAALAVATAAWLAPAAAAEAPARSFADSASAAVRGAATGALEIARGLTSSALDLIGIRYKWGGTTPEAGLDCSGLVQFVFQQVTGVTLPRTAKEMSGLGEAVPKADLAPGDLVFFNTRRFAFSHVGIYLGDNRFVHAPRRGREVEVATIDASYWQKRFNGARRLVGVLPEMMPSLVTAAHAAPPEALVPPHAAAEPAETASLEP